MIDEENHSPVAALLAETIATSFLLPWVVFEASRLLMQCSQLCAALDSVMAGHVLM